MLWPRKTAQESSETTWDDDDDDAAPWLKRWWPALAVVLVCLAGFVAWKLGAYRAVKEWRVARLIVASQQAQQKRDYPAAVNSLRRAWVLLPHHVPTLRALAEFEAKKRSPSTLASYQRLLATGRATADDWVAFTREAIRQQRLSDASAGDIRGDSRPRDLSRLPLGTAILRGLEKIGQFPETAARPDVLTLKAERLLWDGQRAEAIAVARQAVAASVEQKEAAQLVLARLLLSRPAAPAEERLAEQTEGMDLLSQIALTAGPDGLEALEYLIDLATRPEAPAFFAGRDVERWRLNLEQHPEAEDRLLAKAWSLHLAATPERSDAIFQEMADAQASTSLPRQLEAARWLNQHNQYRPSLKLAEAHKLASEPWLLVFLDALAGEKRWEEVAALLSSSDKLPLAPAVRRLFQFRAAAELGQNPDAFTAWREIRQALPRETYQAHLFIAGYAERIGFPAGAAAIYRRLLDTAPGTAEGLNPKPLRLAAHLGLIRTGAAAMPLAELEQNLAAFHAEFPALADVENDLAYIRLLNNSEVEAAAKSATRLLQQRPELLAYRTTAALAHLRQNNPTAALKLYEGWTIDWLTAPDRFKAIYAAVLTSTGRLDDAAAIRQTVRLDVLRSEERKLAGLPE